MNSRIRTDTARPRQRGRRNARAFTLLEIVIILILLGIITAIAVPRYVDLFGAGKKNVTQERMNNIRRAIMGDPTVNVGGQFSAAGFRGDLNQLPSPLSQLTTQGALPAWNPFTHRGWNGPYIDTAQLTDGWGNAIAIGGFDVNGVNGRAFTLRSAGPDGIAGNADDVVLTVNY
jgi:type II secretory pathway pseudopilin PulG